MPVAATDYLDAIAHLPSGAVLSFDDVSWKEYEELLAELGEGYAVRIFYDNGRMEIMAPSPPHEGAKGIISSFVIALRDELDIDIESLGSTTYRSQWKAKGAEPDDCFYVQHAAAVIGRHEEFDIETDPPPDIVVEVERTSASLNKFVIYAALGVPEIWQERKKRVRFYLLSGGSYVESANSSAFPFLDSATLSEFLAKGLVEGSRKAARAFRAWVREHRPAQ
jgi:Uma2 family endonuclease